MNRNLSSQKKQESLLWLLENLELFMFRQLQPTYGKQSGATNHVEEGGEEVDQAQSETTRALEQNDAPEPSNLLAVATCVAVPLPKVSHHRCRGSNNTTKPATQNALIATSSRFLWATQAVFVDLVVAVHLDQFPMQPRNNLHVTANGIALW